MSDKRYFTGKPCKRGHVAERYTSSRVCVICRRELSAKWQRENQEKSRAFCTAWREANPEKAKAATDAWREQNKEHVKSVAQAYRDDNREYLRAASRAYYQANIEKERERGLKTAKSWARRNKGKVNALSARKHAGKLQRTPEWANLEAIRFFYECCPAGCHVDHIIPLRGKFVSGLHVETNLQWLPDRVNMSKGNYFALL